MCNDDDEIEHILRWTQEVEVGLEITHLGLSTPYPIAPNDQLVGQSSCPNNNPMDESILHNSPPNLFKYVATSYIQIASLGFRFTVSHMWHGAKPRNGKSVRVTPWPYSMGTQSDAINGMTHIVRAIHDMIWKCTPSRHPT